MKAWLRSMLPRTLGRRSLSWAARTRTSPLFRPCSCVSRLAAPYSTYQNTLTDGDSAKQTLAFLPISGNAKQHENTYSTGRKDADLPVNGRGHTANQFAEFMTSHQVGIQPEDAVTWYTLLQEDGHLPKLDVGYYSGLRNYPRAEEYPKLPSSLFLSPMSEDAGIQLIRLLEECAAVESSYQLVRRPDLYLWRHTSTVNFKDVEFIGSGDGESRDQALVAACSHLLFQLHESKLLDQLVLSDQAESDKESLTREDIEALATSKMHVHNYAARFLQIPDLTCHRIAENHVVAKISIRQLGLQTTATAASAEEAEMLAYALLKDEINKQHGTRSHAAISLQEPDAINLDNCREILEFHEYIHWPETFRWDMKKPDPSAPSSFVCSIYWRGRRVGYGTMPTAARTMWLTSLIAAVSLAKIDPGLFNQFRETLMRSDGILPRKHMPIPVTLEESTQGFLQEIAALVDNSIPAVPLERLNPQDHLEVDIRKKRSLARAIRMSHYNHLTDQSLDSRSEELKDTADLPIIDPGRMEKNLLRSRLPIFDHRSEIISLVKNNPQCIVVGTAGCGKSTQVPQIIFNDAIADGRGAFCNILQTEPRRSTAVALATRVAQERDERLGDVVGYRIGGASQECHRGGRITFCTAEILCMQLETITDELLDDTSHIIVDEVHERDGPTSRLLTILKLAFSSRLERGLSLPKLILMSATLNSDFFEDFFELTDRAGHSVRPPVISIPGRQFPVEHKYIETVLPELKHTLSKPELDSVMDHRVARRHLAAESDVALVGDKADNPSFPIQWKSRIELEAESNEFEDSWSLVVATIAHLAKSTDNGDILVFLTGWYDLVGVQKLLLKEPFAGLAFTDSSKFSILLLHSSNPEAIAEAMSDAVEGCRRILLATNVAETSLTFPDVKYIIDLGKSRVPEYSATPSLNTLYRRWESKANLTQRAGRVGRVQPGEYYALYSEHRLTSLSDFGAGQAMRMGDFQNTCLRARLAWPSVPLRQLVSRLIDPPPTRFVDSAIAELQSMGALTAAEDITDLGRSVMNLMVPPSIARMLLLGVLFQCLHPVLAVAAMYRGEVSNVFASVDPGSPAMENRHSLRQTYSDGTASDCISKANIVREYRSMRINQGTEKAIEWATENNLQANNLDDLSDAMDIMHRALKGLRITRRDRNDLAARSGNRGLVKALIMVGLHQRMAIRNTSGSYHDKFSTEVKLWRSCLAQPMAQHVEVCCFETVKVLDALTGEKHIYDVSPVSPMAAALFGTSLELSPGDDSTLIADGWIPLKFGNASATRVLLDFKRLWDQTLTVALQRLCNPKKSGKLEFPGLQLMLQTVADLLEYDEKRWRYRVEVTRKEEDGLASHRHVSLS